MNKSTRIQEGVVIKPQALVTIHSERIQIPDPGQLVHLQFRRFAGCPVCNLHLHSIVQQHKKITAASVREVIVFHSTRDELLRHAKDLPFAVIADPDKTLYVEYGVESAPHALLNPRAWEPVLRGIMRSIGATLRKQQPIPPLNPQGGRFGLPADFLIASDGRILAYKYGSHAYDQWSVDEILSLSNLGQHIVHKNEDIPNRTGLLCQENQNIASS
jgi:AhpC/TSA family